MKRKKTQRWWHLSDEPPSPRLLRWVRGTILVGWAIVLVVTLPGMVAEARHVLQSQPQSASRSAALRQLATESFIKVVAMPFIVLGIFGYGVFPRRNAAVTGGPLSVSAWRAPRAAASRKPRRDAEPEDAGR